MVTMLIDGIRFEGRYRLGENELPSVPALAIVCTEAGEGTKIMSVVHDSKDIKTHIETSPKMKCWKDHAYRGNIDVYINTDDMSEEEREKFRVAAIEKRKKVIFCDAPPAIVDDW